MNNLNVIDQFMQTFITYIDSGFGLLQGDVGGLSSILIGIDITLAALFWTLDGEANVLARTWLLKLMKSLDISIHGLFVALERHSLLSVPWLADPK